ncbi:MAG: HlyD family type I secretion periplasmic adaptor subunit [Nitrococcus sp.]|nr:HlyD family type I secretion periplasmic adaptor subunit [Nitrococcus sp.]
MMSNDNDFSPRLLAVRNEPPAPLPRAVLGTLVALLVLLLVWAFLGRLDIVARAEGSLVPKTRLKVVQPFEGGRVAEILVAEGERVTAGQALMRMDASLSQADIRALKRELALIELQMARVRAQLDGADFKPARAGYPRLSQKVAKQYLASRRAYHATLAEQEATLARLRQELEGARQVQDRLAAMLPIYRRIEEAHARLAAAGNASELAAMERRAARIAIERDLEEQARQVATLQGRIAEAKAGLARIKTGNRRGLTQKRVELSARRTRLRAQMAKQQFRNELLVLTAPEAGIVQNLATHTEGSVVPSGTVLLTIVPVAEPVQAEVYIDNPDIGFIEPGQAARLKLAAYPFQRFGTVAASVERVSPDAQTATAAPENPRRGDYRAMLKLERQSLTAEGERLELRPGMAVVAEIKLGERSVMEYLLSPVRKTLDYAGKER